ncbi:MAG TPA: 23S rRNA (uracil(1939)-C(5))-methyltransferase RlmD [Solirubrobacteraceae bacterium]|nr:23S rRNA (uracil(1939)-C(5))-methyltransferase RlmD [Solirubrobacteraceae bacterium]
MSATPVTKRPERGEELDLRVESLAYGGAGVARLEGYVVFVSGGMPGDRVRAVVTKRKRGYAEARVVEVTEPSPERIEPLAPGHPGASWQVLPYETQLRIKAEQVEDALRRIGKLDGFEMEPIIPAVDPWRYRNKLEYSFGTSPEGELICGFHKPGSWEDIVHVEDDLLASEAVNAARRDVLEWCRAQGLSAYDRRSQDGFLRNLVIREGRRTGDLQVRLVTSEGSFDDDAFADSVHAAGTFWTRMQDVGETTAGGETDQLGGAPQMREELAELEYKISPQAFFQTNTEMAEKLYAVAVEYAGLKGFERVYDLYCGMGTIGLTLAPRAGEVFGLEVIEPAVSDAIANAKRNGITNAKFFAGDVRLAMRDLVEEAGKPDVIVLDPPRAGLSPKIVRRVIEAAPRRIVYVSCNPTTLAPNAAQLTEAGYVLKKVRPVDMFPQTHHIECVAVLDRVD